MTLSYCGAYKSKGQHMTKRIRHTPLCERCKQENYDNGKYCKSCRAIRLAEHKARGIARRLERRRIKNGII